jgi:hypothetical protein
MPNTSFTSTIANQNKAVTDKHIVCSQRSDINSKAQCMRKMTHAKQQQPKTYVTPVFQSKPDYFSETILG